MKTIIFASYLFASANVFIDVGASGVGINPIPTDFFGPPDPKVLICDFSAMQRYFKIAISANGIKLIPKNNINNIH